MDRKKEGTKMSRTGFVRNRLIKNITAQSKKAVIEVCGKCYENIDKRMT